MIEWDNNVLKINEVVYESEIEFLETQLKKLINK